MYIYMTVNATQMGKANFKVRKVTVGVLLAPVVAKKIRLKVCE